jgi:peptidoglycan L-alanyl-D-glutamate endopeptidase CwlK
MARFGKGSKIQLETLHPWLQEILTEAIKYVDFTVLEGHRGQEAQDQAYKLGFSKIRWPHGKHNSSPSLAVDIAPYPIVWADTERFVYFAGWIMAIAAQKGTPLRWGGDWNRDTRVKDEKFRDWGHFELTG